MFLAVLKRRLCCRPETRPSVSDRDPYGWYLPHYPYNSDQPRYTTCGTAYLCQVVRDREDQDGTP
jgi:hypothetical protein